MAEKTNHELVEELLDADHQYNEAWSHERRPSDVVARQVTARLSEAREAVLSRMVSPSSQRP